MNKKLVFLLFYLPLVAIADNPKFHPLEKYCVTRTSTGMMEGTVQECSCEWGFKRYEIHDLNMTMGGFSMPSRQHIIHNGSEIININPDTNQGTVTQNPMYEEAVQAAESGDPTAAMRTMLEGLGSTFSGEFKEVADQSCEIVNNAALGNMCITETGLLLEMVLLGGSVTQVATAVDTESCGDMANYEVPEGVTVTEGPDLGDMQDLDLNAIMEQLQNIQNPQ